MEQQTQVKTAPRKTDAVNVVWRSHATNIMRNVCPSVKDKEVCLGRLKLNDSSHKRLQGYVVFYALVARKDLSLKKRIGLWWKERKSKKSDEYIIMVKAFKNERNKPRKAFILPLSSLIEEKEYRPNDTFRAVTNTEWRYAVRGQDCEILTETFYQYEKRK